MILLCLLSCKTLKESGSSASKDTNDRRNIDYKQYAKCVVSLVKYSGGNVEVKQHCDSKFVGSQEFGRGFTPDGDSLVNDIIKRLKAAGFIEDVEATGTDSLVWYTTKWGFEKHPHHVTRSTFTQVLKDIRVCTVYGGHLPASEFLIYCGEDRKEEFYFTEEVKPPTSSKDIVELFRAAGFKDSLDTKSGVGVIRFDRIK